MKKKAWNKILTIGCAAALLMMSPRIIVMADEPHGEETVLTDSYEEDEVQEVGAGEVTVGDGVTADFNKKTGVLTFYSKGGTLWKDWHSKMGIEKDAIKSIKVAGTSGLVYMPADSAELFSECRNLASIELKKFDTSKVTNMDSLFYNCESLLEVDLSNFNTSNATNITGLFAGCSSIKKLDVSGFDTSKVTEMLGVFNRCSSLTKLDLRSFDTSNVEWMGWMFYCCTNLTELNVSSFDTSKVIESPFMFYACKSLKVLDLSSFDASRMLFPYIFDDCNNLEILITPKVNNFERAQLPFTMYDKTGNGYSYLPIASKSIILAKTKELAAETFLDVIDTSSWYHDSVYWAVRNGVTSGMGEGTFQPMTKLSRAQAVTFLYNLAGKPDVSGLQAKEFTDVSKSAWYYKAVKWAVANKITSGYGTGTFQPNATCTRAMIVTFLANYAKTDGTYKEPTTSASFKDVKAKDWFKKSVDWAVENSITSGYGQGTFSPNVTCNRAMMVTFLKKVAESPKR